MNMFSNSKGKKPTDPEGIRIYDLIPSQYTKTKYDYNDFYRSLTNGKNFDIYSKIKNNNPYISSITYLKDDGNKDPVFRINNSFNVVFISKQTPNLISGGRRRRKQTKRLKKQRRVKRGTRKR